MAGQGDEQSNAARTRELNDTIRYTMWSVFRLERPLGPADGGADRAAEAAEVEELFGKLAADDVVVRGTYDVSGIRADADVMVWWHAATSEQLQSAYNRLRRHGVRPAPRARVVADGPAPAGGVQQEPPPGVPGRGGGAGARVRLPVRALLRVVPPRGRRASTAARRARPDGAGVPRRPREHRRQLRARRLRVDPGLRGRRPGAHRRPDASSPWLGDPAPRPRWRSPSTPAPVRRSPTSSRACPDAVCGISWSRRACRRARG